SSEGRPRARTLDKHPVNARKSLLLKYSRRARRGPRATQQGGVEPAQQRRELLAANDDALRARGDRLRDAVGPAIKALVEDAVSAAIVPKNLQVRAPTI